MRIQEQSDLTDNAWVERIDYLRRLVADQYDTTEASNTPEHFVNWLVESAEEKFYTDDVRILLREATERWSEQYN